MVISQSKHSNGQGHILSKVNQLISLISHSACQLPFMEQDGSCFYLSTESVTWETAKTGCENVCGHLVMIKTAEQQQKVFDFLSGYSSESFYVYYFTPNANRTILFYQIFNIPCTFPHSMAG